jgi:chromosome segregation ATPase
MNRAGICLVAGLLGAAGARAEDSAMLAEVRQLRQDLQTAAATIQRVQIVMFRLQLQGAALGVARQRVEMAGFSCNQAAQQRQNTTAQIERIEAARRNTQNPAEQKADEDALLQFRSEMEAIAKQEQECQVQQAESAAEFRSEEAKMNDLQEQLERLDRTLAGSGRK